MDRSGPNLTPVAPRVRLKDVAREARVSVSTVSAILVGRSDCYASSAVRKRVREVARRLQYRPNPLARGMRGVATLKIGVVLASQGDGIAASRLNAIETRAAQEGYHLLLGLHRGDAAREAEYLQTFLDERVDGLIVRPSGQCDVNLLAGLLRANKPLVTLDSSLDLPTPNVSIDREAGGYLQVRHLLDIGRRHPALVLTSHQSETGRDKVRGMRRAIREAGLDEREVLVVACPDPLGFDAPQMGLELGRRLLSGGRPFDAVAVASDSVAMGVLKVLQESGRSVPEDVAMVGFDDDLFAPYLPVGLSSIHQPRDEFGRAAFDLLLEQLKGGLDAVRSGEGYKRIVLRPRLVVRASSDPDATKAPARVSNRMAAIQYHALDAIPDANKERSCSPCD